MIGHVTMPLPLSQVIAKDKNSGDLQPIPIGVLSYCQRGYFISVHRHPSLRSVVVEPWIIVTGFEIHPRLACTIIKIRIAIPIRP
jgi:hypothetical protein